MVHTKCKCECGRGNATTEFYIDGIPQIYCYGWKDSMTDEPLEVCKNCPDWVYGEQCEIDFKKHLAEIRMSDTKENFKYQKSKKNRFELHDYEITFGEEITHEEAERRLMEAFRAAGIIGHYGQIG